MRDLIRRILDWVDHRTGFETAVKNFLYEDIPASSGWHQVFGSVALFLFFVQAFTGVLLAFNYAPQPGDAYHSLQYIVTQITGGRLIRGLHHWGSSLMVVVVGLHMIQVALWGAYKKPREATWILGVLLLLLVLAFGLTGYLLPWDNRAYWATVVTIQIAGLAPLFGEYLLEFLGGAEGVGVSTFTRFYTLHVLMLPALTVLLIMLHIHLVRKHGVTPSPRAIGRPKKKFYPGQAFKDLMAFFAVFILLFVLAATVDVPLERLADPSDSTYVPRPEWYFLFLFQMLKFFEGRWEVVGAVILPTLAVLALLAVPFLDHARVRRIQQRTLAFAVVGVVLAGWLALTVAAVLTHPGPTEPAQETHAATADWRLLTPVELAGRAYFRREKCADCHNLAEGEPKMGPTLATVSQRKPTEWLMAHFGNPSEAVPGSPRPATTRFRRGIERPGRLRVEADSDQRRRFGGSAPLCHAGGCDLPGKPVRRLPRRQRKRRGERAPSQRRRPAPYGRMAGRTLPRPPEIRPPERHAPLRFPPRRHEGHGGLHAGVAAGTAVI